MPKPERRLVPIVSIDVVGYSLLVQKSERATLRLVQRLYERLVVPTIGASGGKVFKTMGDGLLAEFTSVIGAVEWVEALQHTLHERRIKAPGGDLFQIRAGIVLADVLVSGDDLFGNGVNLAVRVQGYAPPGGMAITKWMHEYLGGQISLAFADLGPVQLKNIPKTVRVYVWHPDGVRPAAQPEAAAAPAIPPSSRPSVVVLPFDNLSGDIDQAYFADAVVEEITSTLSRIRDFFVIARNSAFAYKGRSIDVRQVGKELGVRYIVEGSVRRVGERVRITAQLVETDTGSHIWSDKIDGTIADLFELQDRMGAAVAGALLPSIRRAEIERARSKRPENLAAYDMVMRALPHLWSHMKQDNLDAIELLENALAIEPNYGLAAALCAWAHGQQVAYTWAPDIADERQRGAKLIDRATPLVGEDPTALTAISAAIVLLGGDVAQAARLLDRALEIDPNHSWAWMRRGYAYVYLGDPEKGLAAFEKSARLSPRDPFAFNMHLGMGLAHFAAGRPQQAIEMARQALAERPGLDWPFRDLAAYYAHHGDFPASRDALDKFLAARPGVTLQALGNGLRFMYPSLLARYLQGLKLAGLK